MFEISRKKSLLCKENKATAVTMLQVIQNQIIKKLFL
jgi:hypothetical protein